MHILLQIGSIEINTYNLLSFFLGLFAGVFFVLIIYMYGVFRELRKESDLSTKNNDVNEDLIIEMIKDAQKQFENKEKKRGLSYTSSLLQITKSLAFEIAHNFYPRSETPYLELSLNETLKLNHYITDRIDQLTNQPILKLFRRYTMSTIYSFTVKTKKIVDNKVVKSLQDFGVDEVVKASMTALNAINPVYWIRKAGNLVSDKIMSKIGLSIIAIVGEETYKIYSKKVFNEEKNIDTGVQNLYDDVKEEKNHEK